MAWTTPRTWSAGELVSAADLNEQIRDNVAILKTALSDDGKVAAINSTCFASLSGTSLTYVVKLASSNAYTKQLICSGASARFIVPVGTDKWATV